MAFCYGEFNKPVGYFMHSNENVNFDVKNITYAEGNASDFLNKLCRGSKNILTRFINKVYVNEKKRTVAVVFNNKFKLHGKEDPTNKIVVKCNEEETFDVYKAVSAACMIKTYGSNSAFKAHIRKTMDAYSDSLYDVIAWYLTSVMFGSWDKFVKAVDEAREDGHGRKKTNTK